MENLEEAPIPNSSETAAAQANDTFGYPNDDPAAIARNLQKELQCPVCDQIPSSLPIPSCPSGHFLCKECKKKIVSNGRFGEKPCPVCHSPLGKNNISSHLLLHWHPLPQQDPWMLLPGNLRWHQDSPLPVQDGSLLCLFGRLHEEGLLHP